MGEIPKRGYIDASPKGGLTPEGMRSPEELATAHKKLTKKMERGEEDWERRGIFYKLFHSGEIKQAREEFTQQIKALKKEARDEKGEIRDDILAEAYTNYLDAIRDKGMELDPAKKEDQKELERLKKEWETKAKELLEIFPPDSAEERFERGMALLKEIREEFVEQGLQKYIDGFDNSNRGRRTGASGYLNIWEGDFQSAKEHYGHSLEETGYHAFRVNNVYDVKKEPHRKGAFPESLQVPKVLAILGKKLGLVLHFGLMRIETEEDAARILESFKKNRERSSLFTWDTLDSDRDIKTLLSSPLFTLDLGDYDRGRSSGFDKGETRISLELNVGPNTQRTAYIKPSPKQPRVYRTVR